MHLWVSKSKPDISISGFFCNVPSLVSNRILSYAEYMKKNSIPHSYIVSDSKGIKHLLIEGDNKNILPLLQTEYKDKIDLIYLDPPYNTGKTEGFKYGDKRSNWLEFMREKMILAKPLMSETGFLFISINELEFAHLKILCDEIFGAKNFVSYLVWKKKGAGGIPKCGSIIVQTEFILIYARNISKARLNKLPSPLQKGTWRDFRKSGGAWQKIYRPKQCFPIYHDPISNEISIQKVNKNMIEIFPCNSRGVLGFWMNGKETTEIKIKNNQLKVGLSKKGNYKVYVKKLYSFNSSIGNLIDIPSAQGTYEVQELGLVFNNPKPIALMEYLVTLGSKPDSIILDFFAGSGTTGCAIMKLNSNKLSKRKFILIQNNEKGIFKKVCLPRILQLNNTL